MAVSTVLGHEDGAAPSLIGLMVASVIGVQLQGVGQHIPYTPIAVLVNDAFGAAVLEMHSVKVPMDRQLYRPGAGTVGAKIGTPQLQLAPVPCLLRRVGVHCLIRQHRPHLPPPDSIPAGTGSSRYSAAASGSAQARHRGQIPSRPNRSSCSRAYDRRPAGQTQAAMPRQTVRPVHLPFVTLSSHEA